MAKKFCSKWIKLRFYHQQKSKRDFIQNVLQQNKMELVEGEAIICPPDP